MLLTGMHDRKKMKTQLDLPCHSWRIFKLSRRQRHYFGKCDASHTILLCHLNESIGLSLKNRFVLCACVCGSKTIPDELERDEDKRGAHLINRLATDSSMRFIRARQHTTDVVLGYRSVRNDFIRGDGFMFSVIRSSPIRFAYFFIFYF